MAETSLYGLGAVWGRAIRPVIPQLRIGQLGTLDFIIHIAGGKNNCFSRGRTCGTRPGLCPGGWGHTDRLVSVLGTFLVKKLSYFMKM